MNKFKVINIVLDILILLLVGYLVIFNIFFYNKKNNEAEPVYDLTKNQTKKLDDIYMAEEFKFYDTQIVYVKNYKSTISVNLTNIGDETYYLKGVSAVIYDENKEEVITLYEDTMFLVNPGSSYSYTFESDKDLYESTHSIKYIPIYDVISE